MTTRGWASTDGAFSPAARAAIYEIGSGRCLGCGRPDITAQHRRARGMGGTSDVAIGHPANGVPLCWTASSGCHPWAEANPHDAALLGWRLTPGQQALVSPFWCRLYGWRRWHEEPFPDTPYVGTTYVDPDEDLDRHDERMAAVARYQTWRHA